MLVLFHSCSNALNTTFSVNSPKPHVVDRCNTFREQIVEMLSAIGSDLFPFLLCEYQLCFILISV